MFWVVVVVRRFILDIPYRVRSIIFRLRHGFAQEDCWSLDTVVARWLVPRLRYLAENRISYPGGEDIDDDIWTAILYKMVDAFEIIKEDLWDADYKVDQAEEGLDLFREYFFHLWDLMIDLHDDIKCAVLNNGAAYFRNLGEK